MLGFRGLFGRKDKSRAPALPLPSDAFTDVADPSLAVSALTATASVMAGKALLDQTEIPEIAAEIAAANTYLGQVSNGGHAQFVGNTGMDNALLDRAKRGLTHMDLQVPLALLQDLRDWHAANPVVSARQNGFSERDPALDKLDARFFEADRNGDLERVRNMLRSYPGITIVDRASYDRLMASPHLLNPQYEERKRLADIRKLGEGLYDDVLAPVRAMRAGQQTAKGETVDYLGVTAAVPTGDNLWAHAVATNLEIGLLSAVNDGENVSLHVAGDGLQPGMLVERANLGKIEPLLAHAKRHRPEVIAAALLRGVNETAECAYLTWETCEFFPADTAAYRLRSRDGVNYLLFIGAKHAWIRPYPEGAAMLQFGKRKLDRLRRDHAFQTEHDPETPLQ